MRQFLLFLFGFAAFIYACGFLAIANADFALAGGYAGADQFLYSLMPR